MSKTNVMSFSKDKDYTPKGNRTVYYPLDDKILVCRDEGIDRERRRSPSPTLLTDSTATPAKLPLPTNDTSTGKKTPVSTPLTLKISDPDLVSSSAETTGIFHWRECEPGSRAHSPVCEETVG
ncbi:hypothetical protein NMY22_g19582 [Coprinellus aureogranulatus]|nr:hypothetical protein NMY22_g19582 [Coprinellus aureogranulatus]